MNIVLVDPGSSQNRLARLILDGDKLTLKIIDDMYFATFCKESDRLINITTEIAAFIKDNINYTIEDIEKIVIKHERIKIYNKNSKQTIGGA